MPLANRPDPVPLLLNQLENGNDVLRTGAVRAAAAVAIGDKRVRLALLDSLLDEDPDVRTDAMDALVHCAKPEDGDTIRRSLLGDPVREVKHAAIKALAAIDDRASIPIFRKLVASRAEDEVAWEDDSDPWDEWLDVQLGVIEALGQMRAEEAIQDILDARDDEEGQTLDAEAFAALAQMGSEGAIWLLSVAQTESGLGRKRALEALADMKSDLLMDHAEVMITHDSSDVRRLALPLLAADDTRIEEITLRDPDPTIRCDALTRFAPAQPDLALKALSDPDEAVQATALAHQDLPLEGEQQTSLVDNAIAWAHHGKEVLAIAAVRLLPRLAPDLAATMLPDLAQDYKRPLQLRLAAVTALGDLAGLPVTGALIGLLGNETQQLRTVALTQLAALSEAGDDDATQALAMAMDGTLLSPDRALVEHPEEDGPDLAMSKVDQPPRGHLRISRDGEIIEDDPGAEPGEDVPQSTLASIQMLGAPPAEKLEPDDTELAEDTPEETPAKRRHRRAVEGPSEVGDDLRRVAFGIAGHLPDKAIETAVTAALNVANDPLRLSAWRAFYNRAAAGHLPSDQCLRAVQGLQDEMPSIRSTAADTLALHPETSASLSACLDDTDALVRAVAVRHAASPDEALVALGDAAMPVRQAALDKIMDHEDEALEAKAFRILSQEEQIDTLADACCRSDSILTLTLQELATPDLPPRTAYILMQALAGTAAPAYNAAAV
ncbi:HEAT repeat domain-containing protein [Roseovarius sp. 2305UL8-3]|uniref:HEAT repeat domain-containing protein n=1 Tax=Roseovarius conchicola TaxID=3121636 RepID=UPI0035293DAC